MYIQAGENGIKTTTADLSWRLVINGKAVTALFKSNGITEAGGAIEIFVADTKEECEVEIAKLDLFYEPVEEFKKIR